MNFIRITNKEGEERRLWDEFVLSSYFGHLFQTWDWGEVSRELGWQPLRFAVKENNSIKAAAQVLIRRKGPFSILYVPRGPIFNDCQSFNFLITNLKGVIKDNKAIFLKINPAIEKPSLVEKWYRDSNFVKSGIRELHVCTYLINLNKSPNELWSDFAHMVKKSINKAEREGVIVEKVEDLRGVDSFYSLYRKTSFEKKIKYHSYSFVRGVWEKFSCKGNAEIFLAKYKNIAIAGEFLLLYGNKCEEMWGGAQDTYLELRPYQLLHWHIFNWLKKQGCATYNMGGVPPDETELAGIHFYKRSFGGRYVEFLGEYELVSNTLFYYFWKKIGKLYISRRRIYFKIRS